MTHKELFDKLIYDENISDNVDVRADYEPDEYGNSIVTFSLESPDVGRKKGISGMLILLFNTNGRMVSMEIATSQKDKKKWQIAASEKFINFKQVITRIDQ